MPRRCRLSDDVFEKLVFFALQTEVTSVLSCNGLTFLMIIG